MVSLSPASKGLFMNIDKDQSFCCFQMISSTKRDLRTLNRQISVMQMPDTRLTTINFTSLLVNNPKWLNEYSFGVFTYSHWTDFDLKNMEIKVNKSPYFFLIVDYFRKKLFRATPRQQASCGPGKTGELLKDSLKKWKRANVRII